MTNTIKGNGDIIAGALVYWFLASAIAYAYADPTPALSWGMIYFFFLALVCFEFSSPPYERGTK